MAQWLRGAALILSNSGSSPNRSGAGEFIPSCLYWVLLCGMFVTPAVPYMLTGLAGCSVGRGINRGARKLTRTPTLIQKKKKNLLDMLVIIPGPFIKYKIPCKINSHSIFFIIINIGIWTAYTYVD